AAGTGDRRGDPGGVGADDRPELAGVRAAAAGGPGERLRDPLRGRGRRRGRQGARDDPAAAVGDEQQTGGLGGSGGVAKRLDADRAVRARRPRGSRDRVPVRADSPAGRRRGSGIISPRSSPGGAVTTAAAPSPTCTGRCSTAPSSAYYRDTENVPPARREPAGRPRPLALGSPVGSDVP